MWLWHFTLFTHNLFIRLSSENETMQARFFLVVAYLLLWNWYRISSCQVVQLFSISQKWRRKTINNLEMDECEANMSNGVHNVMVHQFRFQWNFWWFIRFIHISIYLFIWFSHFWYGRIMFIVNVHPQHQYIFIGIQNYWNLLNLFNIHWSDISTSYIEFI